MRILLHIALLFAFMVPFHVDAAVYKCPDGSFQDKPCDKGDSKVVTKRNTAGKPASPKDACAALGLEASQVAQARAEGAVSEKMLGEVDKGDLPYAKKLARKKLIVDVYQRPGSPQEIGVIFEADCAKAREESQKQLPPPRPEPARENAAAPVRAAGDPAAAQKLAVEEKKRQCDLLTEQREAVMAQQRTGGNIKAMEVLNRQRAGIDKQMSNAGCN